MCPVCYPCEGGVCVCACGALGLCICPVCTVPLLSCQRFRKHVTPGDGATVNGADGDGVDGMAGVFRAAPVGWVLSVRRWLRGCGCEVKCSVGPVWDCVGGSWYESVSAVVAFCVGGQA